MEKDNKQKKGNKNSTTASNTNKKTGNKTTTKNIDKKEEVKKIKKENIIKNNPQEKEKKEVKKLNEKKKECNFKKKFFTWVEKVDEHKTPIICFICGLALGLVILFIVYPDRIAELKDGTQPVASIKGKTITADELYNDMKEYYSVSVLLDKIDRIILGKKYPDTEEMKKEIEENAEYWIEMYEKNGYDKESFLANNGFKDYDAFLDYLSLDYRRNTYFDEYLENLITDKDIEKYYNDSVYGDTNTKHILVEVSDDGLSDADAKALAEEIISKLDSGTSWDDVTNEYKDKITTEELGYQAYNASLDEAYLKEMLSLDNDTYSKQPVKSSYGYHIIYRIDQKEKPKLEDAKDSIISDLSKKMKEEDSNLYYKALINLREKSNLEFTDSVLNKKYDSYIKKYK